MTLKLKNLLLFSALVIINLLITLIYSTTIFSKDAYYLTYQNQLDYSRIDELFNLQTKYVWISYVIVPILLLVKNTIVSLCIQTGLLINGCKLSFSKTFGVALTADFVFILALLLKLAYFLIIETDYTLTDVQQFYPLSALNLFDVANLPALLIYPFQTFNIFEFLYWLLLAGGIKEALDTDINQGIKVVFSGYIPALVLWIVCVMFITISLSPTI